MYGVLKESKSVHLFESYHRCSQRYIKNLKNENPYVCFKVNTTQKTKFIKTCKNCFKRRTLR